MINARFAPMSFKGNYGSSYGNYSKAALENAKKNEENGILRQLMKADDSGRVYYELYGGQKCYTREEAIYEIRKNLVDYVR